jgi:hypothetical protein
VKSVPPQTGFLFLFLFTVRGMPAQVVTVTPSHPTRQHVEAVVASSPDDSTRVVVAAMQVENLSLSTWRVRAYWSADAGRTWRAGALPARDGIACGGDPWVAWGRERSVYLVCMAPVPRPDTNDFNFHVWLYRSRDAGESWSAPLQVPVDTIGEWDHPVIVRAPSTGPDDDFFWIAGTRSTRRSGNGTGQIRFDGRAGRFGDFRMFVPPDRANHITASAAAIASDRVTVTYFTMNDEAPRPFYAVRGAAGGFEQVMVRPNVTPWGFPMMTRLTASRPGAAPGIASVWLEGTQAEGLQVLLSRSDDEGRTWSEPVTITAGEPLRFRTHPNVASDRNGIIAVAWFESPDDGPCGDVRVTFSRDGGRTFGEHRRFARGPAPCPADGPLKVIVDRWRGGGDYSGITSPAPGVFDLVWADVRADGHQVRFARLHL